MPKLVEKGDHVVMGQQRRLAVHAARKIADQMCHRCLQHASIGAFPAGAHVVHPRATPFASARGLVQVELAHQRVAALDAVELDGGVPDRGGVFADGDFKQRFDDLEQARQHLGGGEILLELLLTEGVALFLELFGNEGPVPRLGGVQAQMC